MAWRRLERRHWVALGLVLGGVGGAGASMHEWGEVLSVRFVMGSIAALGGVILAIFSERPRRDCELDRVDWRPGRFDSKR